jgi:outer membrane receptor protein involved in Fe transport
MGELSVKDRWKLSLHASNLLNIRYYSIFHVAERGTTVFRRQLTGRTVMFGVQYVF